MKKIIVAPSLLSANFAKLKEEIKKVEAAGADPVARGPGRATRAGGTDGEVRRQPGGQSHRSRRKGAIDRAARAGGERAAGRVSVADEAGRHGHPERVGAPVQL